MGTMNRLFDLMSEEEQAEIIRGWETERPSFDFRLIGESENSQDQFIREHLSGDRLQILKQSGLLDQIEGEAPADG